MHFAKCEDHTLTSVLDKCLHTRVRKVEQTETLVELGHIARDDWLKRDTEYRRVCMLDRSHVHNIRRWGISSTTWWSDERAVTHDRSFEAPNAKHITCRDFLDLNEITAQVQVERIDSYIAHIGCVCRVVGPQSRVILGENSPHFIAPPQLSAVETCKSKYIESPIFIALCRASEAPLLANGTLDIAHFE